MKSPGEDSVKPDRTNFLISFVFHAVVILALVVMAAHEGLLGKQLKKIAVEVIHEKPPEKPKEPEKPKKKPPRAEPPKAPAIAKAAPAPPPVSAPPPAAVAPAASIVAPPAAELPAFAFDGGKTVQSSSDPIELYRGYVESALRSKWNRPAGIADDAFVAEIEITVSADGQISRPEWKKNSGNQKWDDSVNRALASARNLDRPPPARFPNRVLVRFDVQDATEPFQPYHPMKTRSAHSHGQTTLAELNITPLLDLVFVLLVIFIITTPQMMNNLEMTLPSGKPPPKLNQIKPEIQRIAINGAGQVTFDDEPLTLSGLRDRLAELKRNHPDLSIVVKGADEANYQAVVTVLDLLRQLDITKVGLTTETSDGQIVPDRR